MTESPCPENSLGERYEEMLASLLGLALHFLRSLHFAQGHPQQVVSVCLYTRLVELAFACKALMEKDALVGIPILHRSTFEADVDLTNCMKYRDYPKRMTATFLGEKVRFLKEVASSRPNPFFAVARQERKPKADLATAQKKLDELVAGKAGPIRIRCRAEMAGKLDEYLSVYSDLCLDSHNNIGSLEEWHLRKVGDGESRVVAFKRTKGDLTHHLNAISVILLEQTKALAEFLGTEGIDLQPYFAKLQSLQREMLQKETTEEANNPSDATSQ